jgi:hypothetical protein
LRCNIQSYKKISKIAEETPKNLHVPEGDYLMSTVVKKKENLKPVQAWSTSIQGLSPVIGMHGHQCKVNNKLQLMKTLIMQLFHFSYQQ